MSGVPVLGDASQPTQNMYTALHFIPNISNSIKNSLSEHNPSLKIAYKTSRQLKSTIFDNMKTKISAADRAGVVYKIDCSDCDQSYVGETSKKLSTRVGQHQNDYKNRMTPGPKTALINHTLDTNHKFNFLDPSVLDREDNVKKRRLLEAGHIIMHSPGTVNIKSDSRNIGTQYYGILNRHKLNLSPRNIQVVPPNISPHPNPIPLDNSPRILPHR
jgi:predicted GIY-YIG superfamily endonuclease